MIVVKRIRNSRNWSVVENGVVVEGGFFMRENAEDCAHELRRRRTREVLGRKRDADDAGQDDVMDRR